MKKLFCENCNWQGVEKQLQEMWVANPNNPKDEYLNVVHCCPNCFSTNIKELITIVKPENE